MKRTIILTSFIVLLFGFSAQVFAQGPETAYTKISNALKAGDAEALSGMFNSSVEITLPDDDGAYSAQQASFVIKEFFAEHTPKGFTVSMKGESGGSYYIVGSLETGSGVFDTNLLLNKAGDEYVITQIRFEPD